MWSLQENVKDKLQVLQTVRKFLSSKFVARWSESVLIMWKRYLSSALCDVWSKVKKNIQN